jgi:hypothetical protein
VSPSSSIPGFLSGTPCSTTTRRRPVGWACSFSRWRWMVPTRSRAPSRQPPRGTPRR